MMNLNKTKDAVPKSCPSSLIFRSKSHFHHDRVDYGPKIDFENLRYPIFDCPKSSDNVLSFSFGWKNLLNFVYCTMKFYNCHHTNA